MSDIRAIGFDLDGTLFDHRGAAGQAVGTFLLTLGFNPSPERRQMWFDIEAREFERWRSGEITF